MSPETAAACIDIAGGSPVYAYSLDKLEEAADSCLAFPNAYGLTVRYAMKACPNSSILKFFNSKGIHIDASSGYEVKRAISAGIPAENISLSTQELPADFVDLVKLGIKVNAWYVIVYWILFSEVDCRHFSSQYLCPSSTFSVLFLNWNASDKLLKELAKRLESVSTLVSDPVVSPSLPLPFPKPMLEDHLHRLESGTPWSKMEPFPELLRNMV